jgi:TRAP-type C4-dicarboxylate transport system permease small subunit
VIRQIKNALDKTLEIIVMLSVAILVLDVLWQVFTRKVLNNPSQWTEELAIFLLIWVALLGAAVALSLGAHLGIDYFVGKLPRKKRIFTEIIVFILILLFAGYVMLFGGFDLVRSTFELGQVSPVFKLKMGYVYIAVPLSGFFMVIYSFLGMCERINAFKSGEEQ